MMSIKWDRRAEFDVNNERHLVELLTTMANLFANHGTKWFADALVAYLDYDVMGCTCEPDVISEDCVRCYIRDRLNMDVLED